MAPDPIWTMRIEHSQLAARVTSLEAELDAAKRALAEAGVVLEALWMAEHDGHALGPDMKAGVLAARDGIRAVLMARQT